MKVLSRYITLEFLKVLTFCLIIFLSLYIIVDFLQKIDNLIDAQVQEIVIFSYFLYKIPFVLVQMLPPASMISVIIILSVMKRRNEILAIKAGGLNLFSIARPLIIFSLLIGVVVFFLSEVIVPYTSSQSNRIWKVGVEKHNPNLFYGSHQIWYKGKNSIYWFRHFDYEKKLMENPTFYFFDNKFHLVKKIDGRNGFWVDGRWRIEKGIIQEKNGGKEWRHLVFRFMNQSLDMQS